MLPLPVDAFIDEILRQLRDRRAVVITAAPGAGKTTRVPPALVVDGPVLLLQPRRVAARAIARRIADEHGWTVGREVGWHVRFDQRFSRETRLLVATEGVLTAKLQHDPLLADFRTIVIDEFHERSIHADLGIAFARQAWLAREDLRLVVMSATLDVNRVSRFLNDCPVVEVPGRLYPVETSYRPGIELERAVTDVFGEQRGSILCFLPGAPEIRRAGDRLASLVPPDVPVLPLHGSLDADDQDRALTPSEQRRVILATNIAETTLTVPDVRVVIDTGLQKVARYDANRGVDSLETERVSQDSADQRAGRAGRLAEGIAVRLWDSRDRLRPFREPEIARIDLASVLLDVIAWGGDPAAFEWFQAPSPDATAAALHLLRALGATDASSKLTSLGRDLHRLPLHPRLARVLLAANGAHTAARACAVLTERHYLPALGRATTCDLLMAVDDELRLPGHVRHVAAELRRLAESLLGRRSAQSIDEVAFRRAVLAGYPDRVARRRAAGGQTFLLSSGTGARQGRESGVYDAEFIVAVDVTRGGSSNAPDAIVRVATAIDRDWLEPTSIDVEHVLDASSGTVRANRVERYGAVTLRQAAAPIDAAVAAGLVAKTYLDRGLTSADEQLMRRLECAGLPYSREEQILLVQAASQGRTRVDEVDLFSALPHDACRTLDREAPADLILPSGRRSSLDYRSDGRVVASVKLQELFGLAETPRLGRKRVPVTFELLAPNGRPVQVTADLRSFWSTGYPEVRKELRARYPKHPWPEDPWTAPPTHRPLGRRLR